MDVDTATEQQVQVQISVPLDLVLDFEAFASFTESDKETLMVSALSQYIKKQKAMMKRNFIARAKHANSDD